MITINVNKLLVKDFFAYTASQKSAVNFWHNFIKYSKNFQHFGKRGFEPANTHP